MQSSIPKIRIGIDARTIAEKGGVRRYVINLIEGMRNYPEIDLVIFYNTKKLLGTFPGMNEIALFPDNKNLLLIYDLLVLPFFALKYQVDILHLPKSSSNFFPFLKKITTLHDLIPISHPETEKITNRLYWKIHFWLSAKFSNQLITDSDFSRNEIIKKYKVDKNKITTIYLGVDAKFKKTNNDEIQNLKRKYHLSKRFILMVGTIQPRKNIQRSIEAIEDYNHNNDQQVELVILGRFGWKIDPSSINNSFTKIIGFVPEHELPIFYSAAQMLLFPSIAEGFGFPIIEAQACGCPVITSNTSSMAEIANSSAHLANPFSSSSINSGIQKVMRNQNYRKMLIDKGYNNANKFTWNTCIADTIKIYKKLT